MAEVKVPKLLYKMSLATQRAWYKKHGMEMPTAPKEKEPEGKSAAAAKRVKVAPRKTIAVEPDSVRAINAARQKAYMAKGGRQPIGAMGSGGSNVMAGAGQSTIKDLKASIKAGFNPKVSLDPYQSKRAKKAKNESVDDAAKRKRMFDLKLKMIKKVANKPALNKPSKFADKPSTAMSPRDDMKLAPKAPSGKGGLYYNEEVESVEESVATAQKVMDRAKVVANTNPDPKKRFAAGGLAQKAMLRTINPTGVNTGITRGGGNKTYRMLGKIPPYQLTKKTGVSEEVEQIDEIKISDVIAATRGKSPEEKEKIIKAMREKERASKPAPTPRKPEPAKDIPMHMRVYPPDMKYHGDSVELEGSVMNEVTKKEAEKTLGGPTKEMPKGPAGKHPLGYRLARSAARKVRRVAQASMKKEEVQHIDEAKKPDASMAMTDQLKMKMISDKDKRTLGKVADLMAAQKNKDKPMKKEHIEEKLTAADPASKWISDFVHSDNPKFADKSKQERIQQALGAYYAAKRNNEEVEQVDERNMENKAKKDAVVQKIGLSTYVYGKGVGVNKYDHKPAFGRDPAGFKITGRSVMKDPKVKSSQVTALKKANEEVEQVDEVTGYEGVKNRTDIIKRAAAMNRMGKQTFLDRVKARAAKIRKEKAKKDVEELNNEEVEQVEEKVEIFYRQGPGADMVRYHKDPTNPDVVLARKRAADAARKSRVAGLKTNNMGQTMSTGNGGAVKAVSTTSQGFKKGYRTEEVEQVDEATKRALNITMGDLEVIKSGDHETVKNHMAKMISRATDSKMNARPLRHDKAKEFLDKIHGSTNVGQLQKMAYNMYLGGDDEGKAKYGKLHVYKPQSSKGRDYQKRYGIDEEIKEEVEQVDEAKVKMTDAHKKAAREVHRELRSNDQQVGQVFGNRIRHMHNLLRTKYGKEWRSLAGIKEEVEQIEEGKSDTSLAAKAEKSGVSLGTLKAVFRRGVAAWNSGHRPGTTPSQWGHARVNSYINKGKTYHTADKDLRKEEVKGKDPETSTEVELAKKHGNPKKITYGDVIKARIEATKKKVLNNGE